MSLVLLLPAEDHSRLEHNKQNANEGQVAAFRLALSNEMLHIVEVVVGFKADADATVDEILDSIFKNLRAQRNVALNRPDSIPLKLLTEFSEM